MTTRLQAALWSAAVPLILLTATATAQTIGRADDDGVSAWRVVAAFLLCAVLAVAAALILRARQGSMPQFPGQRTRRLRLVETLRLGRQVSLSIVACDGEELLLLSSDQAGELIRCFPHEEPKPKAAENVP